MGVGGLPLPPRTGPTLVSFWPLEEQVSHSLRNERAFIAGKISPRDRRDGPPLKNLFLPRETPPCFFAFDLLACDGKDLRTERLLDRKLELRRLLARSPDSPLKYTEYIDGHGMALFERICELDLEGIVAKQKSA